MVFKAVILILLLIVLFSLATALVAMARGDKSDRMVKSLSWRIGLSVLIFILLLIGQAMGLITPHGLYGSAKNVNCCIYSVLLQPVNEDKQA